MALAGLAELAGQSLGAALGAARFVVCGFRTTKRRSRCSSKARLRRVRCAAARPLGDHLEPPPAVLSPSSATTAGRGRPRRTQGGAAGVFRRAEGAARVRHLRRAIALRRQWRDGSLRLLQGAGTMRRNGRIDLGDDADNVGWSREPMGHSLLGRRWHWRCVCDRSRWPQPDRPYWFFDGASGELPARSESGRSLRQRPTDARIRYSGRSGAAESRSPSWPMTHRGTANLPDGAHQEGATASYWCECSAISQDRRE